MMLSYRGRDKRREERERERERDSFVTRVLYRERASFEDFLWCEILRNWRKKKVRETITRIEREREREESRREEKSAHSFAAAAVAARTLFLSLLFSLSLSVSRTNAKRARIMRFPFFEPILLQRTREEEEDEEDEEEEEDEMECALNAEIDGKFLAAFNDDTNGGARKLLPDVARVVALDNLWKKKKKRDEEEEEEERRAFVKALASVNVGGQTDEKIDVRASVEKYWERETVDGSVDGGDDEEKTLGAKSFVVDAASRNGGIVGEVDLFERLERVFPQTVFARAPVESFVFRDDGGGGDDDDDDEHRKRFKYDAIVYNASDETSTFRYHIDGCPMTLLHPQSAFAKAYGGNYANRTPMRDDENGARASVKPRFVSLLVYLNDEWDPEWGGETKFLDEDSQIGLLVAAKPGRVVLFDSDVKHSVCPTTTSSTDSNSNNNNKKNKRFSLVMKLIALPKHMFDLKKNEKEEREEDEKDLLRVNPRLGFGPATPIGSAKRLRSIVEATTRRLKVA